MKAVPMAVEIERKFLVDPLRLGPLQKGINIQQGFIATQDLTVVRVRLAGENAWLTLKGRTEGATRTEFEYPIPIADARQILAEMCGGQVIAKTRYIRKFGGHLWEIDVFEGPNAGLIVAEVELSSESEELELPNWILQEVTSDPRYYNVNLLTQPYTSW